MDESEHGARSDATARGAQAEAIVAGLFRECVRPGGDSWRL